MTDAALPLAYSSTADAPGRSKPDKRYAALDALRGFAVLGILLRNIFVFGMPTSAFSVPRLWSVDPEAALFAWGFVELFVDGAMRALFSMMFGASALLLLQRSEAAPAGIGAADLFYRRQLWLIAFGMVHAYLLLSPIDVLAIYGMLGLMIYPLRNVRARNLLITAGVSLALVAAVTALAWSISEAENSQQAAADQVSITRIADNGSLATGNGSQDQPETTVSEEGSLEQNWLAEVSDRREGYLFNLVTLAESSFENHSTELFKTHLIDIGALMLIGMAFLKLGILTGQRSRRFYLVLMVCGYALGIADNSIEMLADLASGENPSTDSSWTMITYDFGRIGIAFGHLSLVMLLIRLRIFKALSTLLCATGRLALTNYVLQTVICTTLFFGHGLALYGHFDHQELLAIAVSIALLQMFASWAYLRKFNQGPLEWLLRRLVNFGASRRTATAGQPGFPAL